MTMNVQDLQPAAQAFRQAIEHHQRGAVSEAQRMYRAILAQHPRHFDSMHLLGVSLYQTGRLEDSIRLIDEAIRIEPNSAPAYNNRGNALRAMGRVTEAIASYETALRLDARYAEAHYNCGVALADNKFLAEAVACYDKAIAIKPDFAEAHYNRGNALTALKRHAEALSCFEAALAVRPGYAEAFNNRGNALKDLGRPVEALESYARALELLPSCAEAMYNSGNALNELQRYEEAIAFYNRALAARPNYSEALYNGGNALKSLNRLEESLEWYARAVAIRPDYAEAYNNSGNVLKDLGRLDEAVASYDQACTLKPDYSDAFYNRGNALKELKRVPEALESYDRALAIKPSEPDYLTNKGLALLLAGDLRQGTRHYEYRTRTSTPSVRTLASPQPLWTGAEDITGKRLLVYWEQGFGDTIQFCRYLKLFGDTGAEVLFSAQRQLRALLSGLLGKYSMVDEADPALAYDMKVSLLSAMHVFGTAVDTVPASVPYLRPHAGRVAAWRDRLNRGARRFTIGICWQGSKNKIDIGRSFPLRCFEGLSRIPGIRLISLHKGAGEAQLAELPEGMAVETLGPDFDSGPDAFLDTAAVMAYCDLVVTSDTATAHLAGALGVPVWVAIKHVPDWRWMLDRRDCPWYPSMTLYRQQASGDWAGVFSEIERDVVKLMDERATAGASARAAAALPTPEVPVSWGELIDKITILEIKSARLTAPAALANVRRELDMLAARARPAVSGNAEVASLTASLKAVNEALWEIEDKIREKEALDQFDEDFIRLARSVYINNDERAKLKREINLLLASGLVEEKGYASYRKA